jgi:hypothetical protein
LATQEAARCMPSSRAANRAPPHPEIGSKGGSKNQYNILIRITNSLMGKAL